MLGKPMVEAVLADYRTAPIGEPLRAMLAFLRKLTLAPAEVTPADAAGLLAAGLSPAAIVDALYVAYCFNLIDRIADAVGFAVLSPEGYARSAGRLLKRGYLM